MSQSKALEKITTRQTLSKEAERWRAAKKIIGFTSGVFDLLHAGHVSYLQSARAQCDVLVVAMNSDVSVRSNKGELRPIISWKDRAQVLAGLSAVDFVFSFDEQNNHENIEALKPTIYFKAGDYSEQQLTSKALVESYGGKVVLVPFETGYSSSTIIEKVLSAYGPKLSAANEVPRGAPQPVVFLDRDGTINRETYYLHEPEKLEILPGVIEALKTLRAKGFRLVVVTNQPGIGLGYYKTEDMFRVHGRMLRLFGEAGVVVDKVYYCPHTDGASCDCRKPKAGMITRATKEMSVDLSRSFIVGDRDVDVGAGKAAGIKTVLVKGTMPEPEKIGADYVVDDLLAAAKIIAG